MTYAKKYIVINRDRLIAPAYTLLVVVLGRSAIVPYTARVPHSYGYVSDLPKHTASSSNIECSSGNGSAYR